MAHPIVYGYASCSKCCAGRFADVNGKQKSQAFMQQISRDP